MKAAFLTSTAMGRNRVVLADVLPLSAPLVVQVFPIYKCNIKCSFCHFAIPVGKRHFVSTKEQMPLALFAKVVTGMRGFPVKPRVLRFVGIGEPLLHPLLSDMVWFATDEEVAESTEVLTNGLLLTERKAYNLHEAGLSKLVVSIQGTTAEKYKEVCGVAVDPRSIADKIAYWHSLGGKSHVKIINVALDGPDDLERFKEMFEDVCDTMAVEHAGPIYPSVPFNENVSRGTTNQYGAPSTRVGVCPQPFASLQVNPDGNVVPCYSAKYPEILGNAINSTLPEIWNGEALRKFRCRSLAGRTGVCATCEIVDHRAYPQDSLDAAADRLKGVFECS